MEPEPEKQKCGPSGAANAAPFHPLVMWRDMNSAPLDSTPVLLWNKDWIDEDFNISGVVDGFFSADADMGWMGAFWNDCQECWDTRHFLEPSRWMLKQGPAT